MPHTGPARSTPADPVARLRRLLGPSGWLDDTAARTVYARDASHLRLGRPLGVALPATREAAAAVLRACADAGLAVVARGTGTGLSGGALPADGQVVLGLSRLTACGAVDETGRRVLVGAGVLNDQVSRHARSSGLHFAPDPSSQAAASIGGNVAENAGGPHCLRHGVTLQHVRRLAWLDAEGRAWSTGCGAPGIRGLDLATLLCGSEGTLGLVTDAELSLVPVAEAEATLLAPFPRLEEAAAAVVDLLADGLLPVAVETVDRAMLVAVEAAFGFGFPTDVDAVVIAEFAGAAAEVAADGERARRLLAGAGAPDVRLAADAAERARLWQCRKRAFGAVGRLAPSYVTMDVVVPLGALPRLVTDIQGIKAEHGVEVATTFHAGDGNLHPGVHYDDRDPEETHRAHAAADAIIRRALALGGSITGEHGVGVEKLHALPWQVDAEAARLMHGVKDIFDPAGRLNPGKVLPALACDWTPAPPVPGEIEVRRRDLTVTAPAGASLAAVQRAAREHGFWVPLGGWFDRTAAGPGAGSLGTVGEAVDQNTTGPALVGGLSVRDVLLEVWATDGQGRDFHAGAPVFKNVAGYDLTHLLAGAGGILARVRAATFKLRPLPPVLAWWTWRGDVAAAWPRFEAVLAKRPAEPGAPVVVADLAAGFLGVLAAGREAPWDLDGLGEELAVAAVSLEITGSEQTPSTAVDIIPAVLPDWARGASDWFALHAADGGPSAPAGDRFLWQAAPRTLWTPVAPPASTDLVCDPVWQGGVPTPLPAPPDGVPRHLLQGLKDFFDPDRSLPTPVWLQTGQETP
ncbi:MAG: FAD-binding protein [bacterium]|nr:FAD-binding protein [bacterium]